MVQKSQVLKTRAINLRKQGQSYNQISQKLNIPKSTLSNWLSKLSWSTVVKSNLIDKTLGTRKLALIKANIERQNTANNRHMQFRNEARNEYAKLSKNKLFIAGISLYWGEGEKTDSGRVSIVNTDPKMLLVMAEFYRKCLKIPENNLRIGLFIYEDMDIKQITNYWSKLLNIPIPQFIKTQVLKSRSKLTKRRSIYGICSLYCSNTKLSIKIREWIKLLGDDLTSTNQSSGISLPVK